MLGLMAIEQFPALDALYFTVATISTVGYGDLHMVTPAGKILAITIILTGVGCFVGQIRPMIQDLTCIGNKKSWGHAFRFDFVAIPKEDFDRIAEKFSSLS